MFSIPLIRRIKKYFCFILEIKKINLYQIAFYENIQLKNYLIRNYIENHFLRENLSSFSNLIVKFFLSKNTNLVVNFCLVCVVFFPIHFVKFISFLYLNNQSSFCSRNFLLSYKTTCKVVYKFNFKESLRKIPIDLFPIFFSRKNDKIYTIFRKNLAIDTFWPISHQRIAAEKKKVSIFQLDFRSAVTIKNRRYFLIDYLNDTIPFVPSRINNQLFVLPIFLLGYVSFFLKKRPIWTKQVLELYLPFSFKKYIKKVLPLYCFRFRKCNSYRKAWIRFGYNPRIKKKSVMYQTFVVKKFRYYNDLSFYFLKSKKDDHLINFKFNRFYKQICDIQLIFSKKILVRKNITRKFQPGSFCGWMKLFYFLLIKKKLRNLIYRQ